MIKRLLSIILFVFVAFNITGLKAQDDGVTVLTGVYDPQHTLDKKPVPYQHLREADVMWSKTVWRSIQLKEKINFHLYYPETPIGKRMSLISLLMYGIKTNGIQAYDYSDITNDEFSVRIKEELVLERLGAGMDTLQVEQLDGTIVEKVTKKDANPTEVKELLVKELWFFDKQRSVMEVRIIGLCPVRIYQRNPDDPSSPFTKKQLFWVHYPEARKLLANHFVFNPKNDAPTRSFDDVFQSRMFSSYIYQETNAYNNRDIGSYTIGLESMLEAERIKESIFNYEQDLWHY